MTSDQPGLRTLSISDAEPALLEAGRLEWVPVRRRLGIRAFGVNAFRAAREGETVIEDHAESPGQEELYVVLRGSARIRAGEQTADARAGTAVFVPDPETRRHGVALEDDTVVLAVGGWSDRPYRPLPWEPIYLAQEPMRRGDWAAAAEILEHEAGEHRDTAIVQYRMACCHARLGEHDLAFEELRRAIEANPQMRARAATEEDLASLPGLDGRLAEL